MRTELTPSGIIYNDADHTYYDPIRGIFLQGITQVIHDRLYPNMYDGVSPEILQKACEYGHQIHGSLQQYEEEWTDDGSPELKAYQTISAQEGWQYEKSEFNVFDGDQYSSNIDLVTRVGDNEFDLIDFKTVATLDAQKQEIYRYQLSIYAMMLEHQCPGCKVRNLHILHLRFKGEDKIQKLITVNRVPSNICHDILYNPEFINPYASVPEKYISLEERIRTLISTKAQIEEELNALKADILQDMEIADQRNWETPGGIKFTRKLPTTRSSIDMKLFAKENPNIDLTPYQKISQVAGSLTIAI